MYNYAEGKNEIQVNVTMHLQPDHFFSKIILTFRLMHRSISMNFHLKKILKNIKYW